MIRLHYIYICKFVSEEYIYFMVVFDMTKLNYIYICKVMGVFNATYIHKDELL